MLEYIGHAGSYSLVGVAITLFLVACVALLAALRDRRSAPDRLVTQSVRCPQRQEPAVVTFVERLRAGFAVRRVESCSLLDVSERCSEACVDQSMAEDAHRPAA